jgi:hypothetical protein
MMMFDMEMRCTFKAVETPPTPMLQPMQIGGGGAALHIKGEIR